MPRKQSLLILISALPAFLFGCGGSSSSSSGEDGNQTEMESFSLNFIAKSADVDVNCDTMITGLGSDGTDSLYIRDLRFYISNLRFLDDAGMPLDIQLDSNDFQYNSEAGSVALIDLTSNTSGACDAGEGEGTARTNNHITGVMADAAVASISFDIGISQAVMKDVINSSSAEDAPSPLNEMYWSWASGYRHFVFNFQVMDTLGTFGEGFLHIGSRGCGGDGLLALENKETCDFVNTPTVVLDGFNLDFDSVTVDISEALAGVDFRIAAQEGEQDSPGVSCHSSPMQEDCAPIFSNFGIDMASGSASAQTNAVFSLQ